MAYGNNYEGKTIDEKLIEFYRAVSRADSNHKDYDIVISKDRISEGNGSLTLYARPKVKGRGMRRRMNLFNDVVLTEYHDSGLFAEVHSGNSGLTAERFNNPFRSELKLTYQGKERLHFKVPAGSTLVGLLIGNRIDGSFHNL